MEVGSSTNFLYEGEKQVITLKLFVFVIMIATKCLYRFKQNLTLRFLGAKSWSSSLVAQIPLTVSYLKNNMS